MTKLPPIEQLFILSREMLEAIKEEDLIATWKDMCELGIAQPPYPQFSIQVFTGDILVLRNTDTGEIRRMSKTDRMYYEPLILHFSDIQFTEDGGVDYECRAELATRHKGVRPIIDFVAWSNQHLNSSAAIELQSAMHEFISTIYMQLIVMLATRGVEKEVKHSKLARLGIGKARAEYTTTLRIGALHERSDGTPNPTSATRCPHLRRGHIRNQAYGPSFEHHKKIWIEPVFVNGDHEEIERHRHHYNVSKAKETIA